ncbi:MAG: acyl-CoA dehydratase activase-related protein, partial [candidate division KSB1 bacterium]|nr:acyl-CoA dehydratase activase-related protein [candidate division KSB1 bacterium]
AQFPTWEPLSLEKVVLLRDQVKPYVLEPGEEKIEAYLGLDIGSVTTKLVVLDKNGDLIKEIYTKTDARPIEVVSRGLKEIAQELGDRIVIKGVGTTGSGRELIGELVGADIIKDEITAHKAGAQHVSQKLTYKNVDTIFDIGGQDSKFISIQEGIVVDFTMNEACAAGTGSFLEEQAEKLGINIKGQFAQLALSSQKPVRLGERCTVFMEKDLNPYLQKGVRKEDLVAGLAYSIVFNYLNRVVRGRKIGEVIYFQGGTAYNDAVAAAFATVLNKEIIVPPYNGVIGAIGAAILAKEKMTNEYRTDCFDPKPVATAKQTSFRGFNLESVNYSLRSFTCQGCSNFCDIQEFKVDQEKTYWGDKCSDKYRKKSRVNQKPLLPDLIRLREKLLFECVHEPEGNGLTIGFPRSMYFYDQFPFWYTYFSELGFRLIISEPTTRKIINQGVEAALAEPCFPIVVAHGHVQELIDTGVDYIFQPNVINAETDFPQTESFLCPWGQTQPFVFRQAPLFKSYKNRILHPTIRFRDGLLAVKKELRRLVKKFGISGKKSDQAVERAYRALKTFQVKLQRAGAEALDILAVKNEPGIILIGRPYNIYDRAVNLDVPHKLRLFYGVNVIPIDFLPIEGIDITDIHENMFWNYGRKILQASRLVSQHPNLHIIYLTNFKCGPDSYIKHYTGTALGKPYLILQFDGHSNDAGIMTRCEAYLDSKGFLRNRV